MIYLLYSDGTWSTASSEEKAMQFIEKHWWSFPLDIKGDSRRTVTIIRDPNNIQLIKGV